MFQTIKIFSALVVFATLVTSNPIREETSSNLVSAMTAAPVTIGESGKVMKNDGQYPYIASLQTKGKKSTWHRCVATLIKKDVVLTAAHCTENMSPTNLSVIAGTFTVQKIKDANTQQRDVLRFVNHPDHRKYDKSENDIAIVWVYPEFNLGKLVNVIKLASDNYEGENSFSIGWGDDQYGKQPEFLMRANFIILTKSQCKKDYKPLPDKNITDSMICALHKYRVQSTCAGDSGGPLVIRQTKDPKDDVLLGTTSWGIGYEVISKQGNETIKYNKCEPYYPSVFANIPLFKDWIENNIN